MSNNFNADSELPSINPVTEQNSSTISFAKRSKSFVKSFPSTASLDLEEPTFDEESPIVHRRHSSLLNNSTQSDINEKTKYLMGSSILLSELDIQQTDQLRKSKSTDALIESDLASNLLPSKSVNQKIQFSNDSIQKRLGSTNSLNKTRPISVHEFTADDLLNQGAILFNRNNFEDADAKWRQAYDIAVSSKDIFRQAQILNNMACISMRYCDLDQSNIYLGYTWSAFIKFLETSIKNSVGSFCPWLDIITNSIDFANADPFVENDSKLVDTPIYSPNLAIRSEITKNHIIGPPMIILLLDIISNIGNNLIQKGQYRKAVIWFGYGLSLGGNVLVVFPLPSVTLNKFVLNRIPSETESFSSPVDHLSESTTKLKLSILHRSCLFTISRFLSLSVMILLLLNNKKGLGLMYMGELDTSNDYHRRALDIINLYNSQTPLIISRKSSLPISKDLAHKHEGSILSNWAALRLFKFDLNRSLQLTLLAKSKYHDCEDELNCKVQDMNSSFIVMLLSMSIVKSSLITGIYMIPHNCIRESVMTHASNLETLVDFATERKDLMTVISSILKTGTQFLFYIDIHQSVVLLNCVDCPLEAIHWVCRIYEMSSRLFSSLPSHILDNLSSSLTKSIYLYISKGKVSPNDMNTNQKDAFKSILFHLFDCDTHDSTIDSKLLLFITQSSIHKLEIKLDSFEERKHHSITRLYHRHAQLVDALHQLHIIKTKVSNENFKAEYEEDMLSLFSIPIIGSFTTTLSLLNIKTIKRENYTQLSDVYLYAIEQDGVDTDCMQRLKEKGLECVLGGINVSEHGINLLVGILSDNLTTDKTFEVLSVLQAHTFTSASNSRLSAL